MCVCVELAINLGVYVFDIVVLACSCSYFIEYCEKNSDLPTDIHLISEGEDILSLMHDPEISLIILMS